MREISIHPNTSFWNPSIFSQRAPRILERQSPFWSQEVKLEKRSLAAYFDLIQECFNKPTLGFLLRLEHP